MSNKAVLILATLIGVALLAPGQVSVAEIEKLLGSEDFKVRQETMDRLWKEGDLSIEVLDELSENRDPEIRVRAMSLRRKLVLGLSPDTPEEILDLLDEYFTQTVNGKVRLFNTLKTMKEYGLMLRLKSVETDEEVLVQLNEIVTEILPYVQMGLLIKGDLKEAKELLLLNHDYGSLIAYANLCDHLGELDQEIGRLRGLSDEISKARYLACLRVKGDPTILRAEAERLGDQQTSLVAAFVQGDVRPLFEHLREEGDLSRMDRSYLNWLIAEWDGDEDMMDKYYSRLRHHVQDSPEAFQAKRNLLKMGLWEEVLEGYSKELVDESRFDFLTGQDRNIEALKLFGLDSAELTEEWLEEAFQRTVRRFKDLDQVSPETELFMAAQFFESHGMPEEAARCLERFFDAVRVSKEENVLSWVPDVYRTANRGALIAFAREVKDFELETVSILSSIRTVILPPRYSYKVEEEGYEWLMVKLLDGADNRPPLEVLSLAVSFYQEPLVAVEFFEEIEKKFRDESLAEQDPEVGLNHLLDFAKTREQGSDVFLYLKLLEENGEDVSLDESFYLGIVEEYQKAAEKLERASVLETATNASYLYRGGMVLKKAEVPDGESYLKKARLLSQGKITELLRFAYIHSSMGEADKARRLYDAAILRTQRIDLSENLQLEGIVQTAGSSAIHARDWHRALAFSELESWMLKNPYSDLQVLRARFNVLFCRGMVALEDGRREDAIRVLREAHGLIPQDGILADDFFPALREVDLIELHDELFAKSAELIRENIRFFPKDHNMKNTFGWLASRANRALDEAEGYLKEALEARPLSEAYLDTLAEVYFAKGDREKAVEWSNRSLDQEITDSQLRQQNRRFRFAPFPSK